MRGFSPLDLLDNKSYLRHRLPICQYQQRSKRGLPPFSLIRDFRKQNTHGNVSKISVNQTCYRQIGSKYTNHSPLAWRKEGLKVTLVAVIGGFRSDMSIARKTDGNFGNVSAGIICFPKSRINENGGNLSIYIPSEKFPDFGGKWQTTIDSLLPVSLVLDMLVFVREHLDQISLYTQTVLFQSDTTSHL